MYRIQNLILILCTGFLWLACAKHEGSEQLQRVIQTVDRDPREALKMLENMNLQFLDKDEWMHYVVMWTQARYMSKKDITDDTLIVEAQRYFAGKLNPEMSTRASYYTACFWYQKGVIEKTFEYSLLANHFAQLADNNLFTAKSAQWIGSYYYDQDVLDSARIYYQTALAFYDRESDVDAYKLSTKYMLGRICRELGQLDQALAYFENGLESAQKSHNREYEARFLYNKGIVCRERKAYRQATAYFHQALSKKPDTEDSLRVYVNYARLCRMSDQPDSTKYYLERVKTRILEMPFPYNRRIAYQELVSYYKDEGNIHEMEYFLKLKNKEDLTIKELQNEEKTHTARSRFEQYKQETEEKYALTLKIGLASLIVMGFLLLVFRVEKRKITEKYQELRYQNLFQKMDWQNSLIGSLKGISKTADALCMSDQPITAESVRKQLLPLRVKFSVEFADLAREGLAQFHNGDKALHQLDSEDLCIIYLKKLNHPDESISWMLGYEKYSMFYINSRKREIRRIMTKAGMKENDIQTLFPW